MKKISLKVFFMLACAFVSSFDSNSVALDLSQLQQFGFDIKNQEHQAIAKGVAGAINKNIAAACELYGKNYWANDKKWTASFEAQKKLLTLAIVDGNFDHDKNSIMGSYIIRLRELLSEKTIDKDAIMGNLNGLYFYTSCCLFLNDDVRNEYFRRIRHDQKFGTKSVTNFNDYLFNQTDFYLSKLLINSHYRVGHLRTNSKLNSEVKNWKDYVKHDWYCYSNQYNIFGEPLLPGIIDKRYTYNLPLDGTIETTIYENSTFYTYDDRYTDMQSVFSAISDFENNDNIDFLLSSAQIKRRFHDKRFLCESMVDNLNIQYAEYDEKDKNTWDEYGIAFKYINNYNFSDMLFYLGINTWDIKKAYPDSKSYPLSIDDYIEKYRKQECWKDIEEFSKQRDNFFNECLSIVKPELEKYKDKINYSDYLNRLYGVIENIVLHMVYENNRPPFKGEYEIYFKCLKRLLRLFPIMRPDSLYEALIRLDYSTYCKKVVSFIEMLLDKYERRKIGKNTEKDQENEEDTSEIIEDKSNKGEELNKNSSRIDESICNWNLQNLFNYVLKFINDFFNLKDIPETSFIWKKLKKDEDYEAIVVKKNNLEEEMCEDYNNLRLHFGGWRPEMFVVKTKDELQKFNDEVWNEFISDFVKDKIVPEIVRQVEQQRKFSTPNIFKIFESLLYEDYENIVARETNYKKMLSVLH